MGDSLSYLDNLLDTLMTVENMLIKFCTGIIQIQERLPYFNC